MRNFISWTYVVGWVIWRLVIESPMVMLALAAVGAAIFGLGYWAAS